MRELEQHEILGGTGHERSLNGLAHQRQQRFFGTFGRVRGRVGIACVHCFCGPLIGQWFSRTLLPSPAVQQHVQRDGVQKGFQRTGAAVAREFRRRVRLRDHAIRPEFRNDFTRLVGPCSRPLEKRQQRLTSIAFTF